MKIDIGGFEIEFWTLNKELWSFSSDLTTPDGIVDLVTDILNFFIYFSAVVAVGLIVYSGILYITATGEPDKIQKATKALTAAIIGMVIVFIARFLVVFLLEQFLL